MSESLRDIRALSLEQLHTWVVAQGEKAFRAQQVYEWLWHKGAHDFDSMSNLSLAFRQLLQQHFVIQHIQVDHMQRSSDGTIKNAVRLHDGLLVESVLIPTDTRSTACVSSQVGCSLDCQFCATARLKRMRNLNPDEIYDQVLTIHRQSQLYFERPLSNIVFMGMGEPLMNYPNLIKSIEKITDPKGLGLSPKRITVSTSGVSKMVKKLADEQLGVKLAVSLHSAIEAVRQEIMPFSKAFPLDELRESLQYWYRVTKSRVTYEYVVWKGVNDRPEDVAALVKFCLHVPCKVNLIEYNAIDDPRFQQADETAINAYIRALEAKNIVVKVRRSRGRDIDAACGQLANKGAQ